VNVLEGFFHVARIKTDQRVLAHLGAVDGFDSDLVDGALAARLVLSGSGGNECDEH
jgi:hypothetical protein